MKYVPSWMNPNIHTYRPEIDGLRAIAVIAVIWFHAGLPGAPAGYIGVDIFFVISGYLITSLIRHDLQKNRFSISHFYERRARRILPALYVVTAATLIISAFILGAREMRQLSNSVIFVVTFLSNFHFLDKIDYFDPSANLKPLLHTWSLAVEEQFYVLFPGLLWLLKGQSWKRQMLLIAIISISSFLLVFLLQEFSEPTAFYLLPTRAWELLAGALCAFFAGRIVPNKNFAVSGLVLIVGSITMLSGDELWPSTWTLIPVLGTSLILLHGQANGVVKSTLSAAPFVGLGLVSYSAYLWHHPLMAAARSLSDGRSPNSLLMLALVVLTFLLAFLTWKFVEQPWRKPKDSKFMFGRRALVAAGVSTFLLISVGFAGRITNGWPDRLSPELQDITHRLRHNEGLNERCSEGFVAGDECRSGPSPKMMIWGDSIAMHLMDGLTVGAGNQNLVQSTMSACAPVLGIASYSAGLGANWSDACIRHNDQTFAYLQTKNEIEIVVFSSAFTGFFDNKRNPLRAANGRQLEAVYSTEQALRKTLDAVSRAGRKVVVVAPAPAANFDVGQCLVHGERFKKAAAFCDFELSPALAQQSKVRELLHNIEKDYPVIWLDGVLCPNSICKPERDGALIYRDASHLSYEGSRWLGQKLDIYNLAKQLANK